MMSLGICVVAGSACSGTAANSGGARGPGGGRGRGGVGGAVPVVTAKATQKDVPIEIAAIGNVEAFETVSVRPQVTGIITEVMLHEGDVVKAGDRLFTIDPRPYQAQLEQAEANVARDEALLNQAEAQVARDKAQTDYMSLTAKRNDELVERGIVSKDLAQQAQAAASAGDASVKADIAAVASAKAQLVAQRAAVDNAKLLLAYTSIRAPIGGRTGNLSMKGGNLVTANVTELLTIAEIEPVLITFSVPADHLDSIRQNDRQKPLSVVATPQNEGAQPAIGTLAFVDNIVDTTTDTIKLKAKFDNKDRRLWPGQFARVSLRINTLADATVVPNEAVQTGQDGQFVFVVKDDSTVEQRNITVAQRINEEVVVTKGIKPGETIVTEGQLRLEPGSRIQPPGERGGGAGRGGRGGPGGRGERAQGGQ